MTRINLRPWREERRQLLQKEFYLLLASAAFIASLIVAFATFFLQQQINSQHFYNKALEQEIAALDDKIKEVKFLQKKRALLVERMEVIQGLQQNRSFVVRVFDDIVKTLPAGAFYAKLTRKDQIIAANGFAKTNEDVAELLRKLANAESFKSAMLANVKAQSENDKKSMKDAEKVDPSLNYFEISIQENTPEIQPLEIVAPKKQVKGIVHAKL